MIISCGIDIEEIKRFDKHYFQNGILSDLIYDIFTTREIENFSLCGKKAFLKGFCFKEAFYKAINEENVDWFDIEIIFSEDRYLINTSDKSKNIFIKSGVSSMDVQFSETNQYITCKVLLLK